MNKKTQQNVIIQEIEALGRKCGSIIDAVISTCHKYDVDIETISSYIKYSKDIKDAIRREGEVLNMLEKS